jgi:hypothetical protein
LRPACIHTVQLINRFCVLSYMTRELTRTVHIPFAGPCRRAILAVWEPRRDGSWRLGMCVGGRISVRMCVRASIRVVAYHALTLVTHVTLILTLARTPSSTHPALSLLIFVILTLNPSLPLTIYNHYHLLIHKAPCLVTRSPSPPPSVHMAHAPTSCFRPRWF